MDRREACRNADVGSSTFASTTCGSQLFTDSKWNFGFERFRLLLPSANEVWGKVRFSQACVSLSVQRRKGVSVLEEGFPNRDATPGQRPLDKNPSTGNSLDRDP